MQRGGPAVEAREALRAGDLARALECAEAIDTSSPDALFLQALALSALGRTVEAVGRARRNLSLHVGHPSTLALLDRLEASVEPPLLGEYDTLRVLGQGGQGAVRLVRSRTSGREFAVKTLRAEVDDAEARRRLMAELRTWVDLPEHPNLVRCRFFRSLDEGVAIFADYVDGGSLRGAMEGLGAAERLGVAIQVARGLIALHAQEVAHRDVKPSNVLLSTAGVAQLTDFGLAAAGGGMSPAFCAPEQARGEHAGRAADVFSFGLTVLATYTGAVWLEGPSGAASLGSARLPEGLRPLLAGCLVADPAGRWPSLVPVEEALRAHYEAAHGPYPHPLPEVLAARRESIDYDRLALGAGRWVDPRAFLVSALRAMGRDAEAEACMARPRVGSRRAAALADIEGYAEAEALLAAWMPHTEVPAVAMNHARLLVHRGLIHQALGDIPGAVGVLERAVAALDALPAPDPFDSTWPVESSALDSADTRQTLAMALQSAGGHPRAEAACREAAAIYAEHEGERARRGEALAWMNCGLTYRRRGRPAEALPCYARAAECLAGVAREARDIAMERAGIFVNHGNALCDLGRLVEGLGLYDQAIRLHEAALAEDEQADARIMLAQAELCRAAARHNLGEYPAGLASAARAHALLTRLVREEERAELSGELGMAAMSLAAGLSYTGSPASALEPVAEAVEIFETMLREQGVVHMAGWLGQALNNQADLFIRLGRAGAALEPLERARSLMEHRIAEGHVGLTPMLGLVERNLAKAHAATGSLPDAVAAIERACGLVEPLLSAQAGLVGRFADLCETRANLAYQLEDRAGARAWNARAIEVLEVAAEPASLKDLATCYLNRAVYAEGRVGPAEMLPDFERAEAIFEQLVALGRVGVEENWAVCSLNRADCLLQLGREAEARALGAAGFERLRALVERDPSMAPTLERALDEWGETLAP